MKQRIAADTTKRDDLALSIKRFLKRPLATGLHVVPTTASTLSGIAPWALAKGMYVVGDREFLDKHCPGGSPSLLAPTQFLRVCKRGRGSSEVISAVVFTDQMASTELAPILVKRGDVLQFFPSLEIIASAGYGLPVHCWDGEAQWVSPPAVIHDNLPVIGAIGRYFDACQKLDSAWLMRDRQKQRQPADRIARAHRRLRLYQSVIMASSAEGLVSEAALSAVKRLAATKSAIPYLSRG